MTDRDTFAAAALTGFIRGMPDNSIFHLGLIAKQAYEVADAMLRERGIADRDNCVTGNNPEMPCPLPKEKRAEVSDSGPAAWAVMESDGFGIEGLFPNRDDAAKWCYNRQQIVPLYRHPPCQDFSQKHLTLTDAEREALRIVSSVFPSEKHAATLRGLLERL